MWRTVMPLVSGSGLLIALSGCVETKQPVSALMPERDIVSFASQSGGQVSYACAKGPTTAQTEARAQKAHSVYEEEVASYGPKFAQLLVSALTQHASDAQTLEASVNGRSDQWAQDAALKVERDYRCLPVARR